MDPKDPATPPNDSTPDRGAAAGAERESRLAAWARLLREAPDDRGVGIGRTLVLSVVVGIFAGLGAIALVSMLHFFDWLFLGKIAGVALGGPAHEPQPFNLPEAAGPVRRWAVALLPAFGGLVTGWFVQKFAPEAAGHGTDAAIEAYHFRGGRVRPVAIPVKALATSVLIGTGGSAGCEGPITQIGAGLGSWLAGALRLPVGPAWARAWARSSTRRSPARSSRRSCSTATSTWSTRCSSRRSSRP